MYYFQVKRDPDVGSVKGAKLQAVVIASFV